MAKALKKNPPTIKANKILSSIGWRILWVWSLISKKDVAVTQETAHSANSKNLYNNKKSKSKSGYVQLIDASNLFSTTKVKLGEKNKEINSDHIEHIFDLVNNFNESKISKIFLTPFLLLQTKP